MSSIPENIILKSLQDTITEEEVKIQNKWLKEKKKNVEYYCQLDEIWNSNKRISEETVLFGWNKLLMDIEAYSPKKQIVINSPQKRSLLWVRYIAAVFVGGLISSVIWLDYSRFEDEIQENKVLVQNVIYNNKGVQFLEFPDGSRTWINGFGKLSYPDCFDHQQRVVLLEGKAYFDVKKDIEWPFIVRSNNVDVEVTGTELFVDFTSENLLKVILITGSVNVHYKNEGGKEIISSLIPGQQG
jgi:ferric-dicitrate binding protein FerR (iron transport regulator)